VTLTLDDALARAFATSHRLGEVRARERAAQAQVDGRRAAERPTVTASGGYSRTNHVDEFAVRQAGGPVQVVYPDIPDNYFARASFQWPIYTEGRLDALERAAEAEARAVTAELEVARADLRLEVTRTYWALITADESVGVVEEGLRRAEAHLRDVKAAFDAGLIPPSDVSLVEAQRSRQRVQLIEAQSVRDSVTQDLRRLTGMPGDEEIKPVTPPGQQIEVGDPNRPERKVLTERIAAAERRETAAAAGRKPTISLSATTDYANPNPRIFPRIGEWRESWDVSISVSVPVWDGGRSKAETAEAAALAGAARERLAELDTIITTEVRQRQLDIKSAGAAITAAEDAIRSAQEARRVVGERFSVGVATSTEVLDAQVGLLQAELDRTRSVANLRLAEARLERALGR
jgi:outer membrane protein TolC